MRFEYIHAKLVVTRSVCFTKDSSRAEWKTLKTISNSIPRVLCYQGDMLPVQAIQPMAAQLSNESCTAIG